MDKIGLALTAILLSSCGAEQVYCLIADDNVFGRVQFARNVSVRTDADLIAEWSKDQFKTTGGQSVQSNPHGILSVPYSFCAEPGSNLQFRAYQDLNRNRELDPNEEYGRYDGTDNGDAAFVEQKLSAGISDNEDTLKDINITLDGTL